jgi:hypothetical protein
MPGNIPAFQVVTTKISTTDTPKNVMFQVLINGSVAFQFAMPGADVTSMNTTTNGGAAGATQTFTYAQDTSRADYGVGYFPGSGV